METEDLGNPFLTLLYNLKAYYEDSIFSTCRTLDEKNIEMLRLIHVDSFDAKNRATQLKIQEALASHSKISLLDTSLNMTKHLILNYENLKVMRQEFAVNFETILWILEKLCNSYFLHQIRNAIKLTYGAPLLSQIERFANIDTETLEKELYPVSELYSLEEYVKNVEELYLPWFDQQPVRMNKTAPTLNEKEHGNFKLNKNTGSPSKPKLTLPKINIKGPKEASPLSSDRTLNLGNISLRSSQKPHAENFSTLVSVLLQSECLVNSSANFDFNQLLSTLKISEIKGICKANIELYDQIDPKLRRKGEKFNDENFRPEISSLTSNIAEFPIAEKVYWKRLQELYPGKALKLCSENIGPTDIQQGELGDCYLLSAMSVLAEQKGFIRRLFHSKKPSITGCYSIWLCDSGEWKNIIVDDYIPCIQNETKLEVCFSKSKSHDAWVVLLEKAFAKLFGNYHNIDGGNLSEAMTVLTGAPTKYFKEKKNGVLLTEQLWNFVGDSLKNGFPITAASRGESRIGINKHMSIVSNHAYAVLDIKEVSVTLTDISGFMENSLSVSDRQSLLEGENQVFQKLIKMRNPWGIGATNNEELSRRSQFWGSKIKLEEENNSIESAELTEEDGTFWISLTDFAMNFRSICACEIHNDYYFSFIRLGEQTRTQNYFIAKMDLKTSGFVYLTVQQKMKKHFRKNESYQYSFGRVILGQVDENGKVISVVDGKYKGSQNIVLRKKLTKGTYIVFVEMDWVQKFYNEVIVTAYAKTKIQFNEESVAKYDIFSLYEGFLKASLGSANGKKFIKAKQYEHMNAKIDIWKYKIERFGLVGLYYLNKEREISFSVRVDVEKLDNMELYPAGNKENHVADLKVDPGCDKLVILKAKIQRTYMAKETDMTASMHHSFAYEYGEVFRLANVYTKDRLKILCKEKGNKIQSFLEGAIEVYSYKYLGGLAEYYVHNGDKGTFRQDIVFESENILVNGKDPKNMIVLVPAKQDYLLELRVKDMYKPSKFARKTKALLV